MNYTEMAKHINGAVRNRESGYLVFSREGTGGEHYGEDVFKDALGPVVVTLTVFGERNYWSAQKAQDYCLETTPDYEDDEIPRWGQGPYADAIC